MVAPNTVSATSNGSNHPFAIGDVKPLLNITSFFELRANWFGVITVQKGAEVPPPPFGT